MPRIKAPASLLLLLAACLLAGPLSAQAKGVQVVKIARKDKAQLSYLLAVPKPVTRTKEGVSKKAAKRPARMLVLLGGEDGNRAMAEAAYAKLGAAAQSAGYIVVCPIAQEEVGFHGEGQDDLADILAHVAKRHPVERGQAILAGISHGARGAFLFANRHPYFASGVAAMPGGVRDLRALRNLYRMPVFYRVGQEDSKRWTRVAQGMKKVLERQKCPLDYKVLPGVKHDVPVSSSEFLTWAKSAFRNRSWFRKVEFASNDGLNLTADFWGDGLKGRPFILLCHQARYSRGEYLKIAPRLMELGFNCLALDARSGNEVHGVVNETAKRAKEAGKSSQYIDAKPDIEAAIAWIREQDHDGTLTLWGSSYSSSLALLIGASNEQVDCVVSFSPGDYLPPRGSVSKACGELKKPTLIVAPPNERRQSEPLFKKIPAEKKVYVCEDGIVHGSKTLDVGKSRERTWKAVIDFLEENAK